MPSQKTYFYGFDYVRAIFCIFVVAWHNFIFGKPTYFHFNTIDNFSPTIPDILYFNILLLAVPVFFQLSLVLYILNSSSKNSSYFGRRIIRLLALFTFWSSSILLFRSFILGWNINEFFLNFNETIKTIVSGGRSRFFYFFSLIILTALTESILLYLQGKKHKNTFIIAGFVLSLIILIISPHFFAKANLLFNYSNPINFIPYVFSAFIVVGLLKKSNNTFTLSVLLLLYILFSIFEWTSIQYSLWSSYWKFILPPYTRVSVVFGTMFIVGLFGKVNKPPPKIISLLSSYSLGIYCLHRFIPTDEIWNTLNVHPHPMGIVNCVIQLFGALIITHLFRKIVFFRRFV